MSLSTFRTLLTQLEYLHSITDNGAGDLAESEVDAAVWASLPHLRHIKHTSLPRNTIATGLIVHQLGLAQYPLRPKAMGLYVNCAPRKDDDTARANNEGEPLVIGLLQDAVPILAVNSGRSLSWIREELTWLQHCKADTEPWPGLRGGEQFRSARMFPRAFHEILKGNGNSVLGNILEPLLCIPEPVIDMVALIDTPHGNIKTATFEGEGISSGLSYGDLVRIEINGVTLEEATYAPGIFAVNEGRFVLAPGSSGHRRDGKRFLEISLRGGSAAKRFNDPNPGDQIKVRPL